MGCAADEEASNGLAAFRAIPMESRYRFLLDDAQYFVMTFIKGPVCRGQVALNVIDDRFWVFFLAPGAGVLKDTDDVARRALEDMSLPAADGSNSVPLVAAWNGYAARERRFQAERATSLRAFAAFHGGPRLDMIWDGDGANPNAALTVMRHFDSATVVRGLVGEPPKTAWLLDYSLFERIYYLLVAGYDVYGNLTHNLNSRLYMDFLRMEGEANFISFLPADARADALSRWYRDATKESLDHMRALVVDPEVESAIPYSGADPQQELFAMLGKHLRPVLDTRLSLANVTDAGLREQLERLAALRGERLGLLPELSYLVIRNSQGVARLFYLGEGHRPPQRHPSIAGAERTRAGRQRAHCGSGSDRRVSKRVFPARAGRIAGIRPSGLFPEIRGRLRIPERSLCGPSNGSEILGV